MPDNDTHMTFVAEDPDKAWDELGQYFFNEASVYAKWQTSDISSAVHGHATTPQELKEEGILSNPDSEEAVKLGPYSASPTLWWDAYRQSLGKFTTHC